MFFHDLVEGSPIILKLQRQKQSITVDTRVYKVQSDTIVVEPIVYDGKYVNVADDELTISVIHETEEKPIIWKNVVFKILRIQNLPYIALACRNPGVVFNRRISFRLNLDVQGVLNRSEKVIVHDISSTGISFYTNKDTRKMVGTPVTLKFLGGYEDVYVSGEIVREEEKDDKYLYGCTIRASVDIDRFISEEQRRRAMKGKR
ncbi:MAG: PilZ domain-containing protein [Lachnospiraceae bacterium]|nr:PilZ domain-containing protein [Lachnospiraceae bacterium]